MQQISNRTNILKETGIQHKKGNILVLWDANKECNEPTSISVIRILKYLFNEQVEGSWRINIAL